MSEARGYGVGSAGTGDQHVPLAGQEAPDDLHKALIELVRDCSNGDALLPDCASSQLQNIIDRHGWTPNSSARGPTTATHNRTIATLTIPSLPQT